MRHPTTDFLLAPIGSYTYFSFVQNNVTYDWHLALIINFLSDNT